MNRQRVIWSLIGAAFVVLLVVRGSIGHGLGRVYVKPETKLFQKSVEEPPIGADPEEKARTIWTPVEPVPADLMGKPGTWTTPDGSIGWTTWTEVSPLEAVAGKDMKADLAPRVSLPRTLGLWLAALFTLAAMSFLYRDNPFYRLTESVVVGVSAAYWMVIGFWDTLVPKCFGVLLPGLVRLLVQPSLDPPTPLQVGFQALAAVLGVMLLMQLNAKMRWMAVWPLAFIIGTTAGLKLYSYIGTDFLGQLQAGLKYPLVVDVTTGAGGKALVGTDRFLASLWASLANTLLMVGTICTLVYFFFSVEHKGAVGRVARVGIWYLMITFGAAFGFTVMGRVTLLAARFEFLMDDWLWLIDPRNLRDAAVAAGALLGVGPPV